MKGGFSYRIKEEDYARIMRRFGKGTFLPIPSQKRNICVTDALIAVLWYTDGIRDRLWEMFIHNKVIDTDCETRIATMGDDELATCFFQLSGARVANLLNIPPLRAEPTRPLLLRAPSAGLEEFLPDGTPIPPEAPAVGEVCSMIYHAFRSRIQGLGVSEDIKRLEDFTIKEDEIRPLLRRAIAAADLEETIEITELGESPPEGSQLLAVYTVLNTGTSTYHLVALCKINGQWHFLDNNVGYSLPFLEEADNDERVRAMRLREELYYVEGELFYTLYDHSRPYPPVSKTGVQKTQNADSQIFWTEDQHKLQRFYVYTTTPLPAPAAQGRDMTNPMFDELEAKRIGYPDRLEILEGPYAEDSPYDVDTTLENGIYTIMSDRDFLDGLRLRVKSTENTEDTLILLNDTEMEEAPPTEEEEDPQKLHRSMVDEIISRGYTKSEAETGVDNADTIEGAIQVIENIRQRKGGRRKTYRKKRKH